VSRSQRSADARRPLDQARLARDVAGLGSPWTAVEVTARTGSTNADLLDRASVGVPPDGIILAAEEQTAGRGRLGRSWVSPPGAALTFSVLLRPGRVPAAMRGWLPLMAGVATVTAVRAAGGLDARLKWPNDVLVGGRKLAGILAEAAGATAAGGGAVVIGVGINVSSSPGELPSGPAGLPPTSLLAEGASVDRDVLLIEILRSLGQWYEAFSRDPDPARTGLLARYVSLSATVGREARVELPGGVALSGVATGIGPDGRLLLAAGGVTHQIAAGDVVHLR
jgi:BirA family transcriptional regulator, biotin operon repressor / biotin---[acetyl-CoA-carboxylase] ligase